MTDDKSAVDRIGAVFVDSYFVVDQELKIQSFNPAFSQMLGLRASERQKVMHAFCYDHLKLEICRDRCIAIEAINKKAPIRMSEIRGERPDGTELTLELSAVPLRNAQGDIDSVLVTHRDVTEERRIKHKLTVAEDSHRRERASLLKVIEERDREIEALTQVRGGARSA